MRVRFTLHRFRLQLVGYRSWSASHDDDVISIDHVRRGAGLAQEELESRVFDAALSELSPADIEFLLAMSRDEGKTLQANLKTRLAKSPSHVSICKKRLLEAGVIDEPIRGKLVFAFQVSRTTSSKPWGRPTLRSCLCQTIREQNKSHGAPPQAPAPLLTGPTSAP